MALFLTGYLYYIIPKGFFPETDEGRIQAGIMGDQTISYQLMSKKFLQFMDIVRKDPKAAAGLLATAFKLPPEDCASMIGKDGGITEGDAHLTNYRENANFFLDPQNGWTAKFPR